MISESDHYGLHSYYCCFPDRHSSARAETTSVGTHPIPRLSVTPHFGHRRTGPVGFLVIQPTVSIGVGGKAQWHMANPSPFAICASAMANCSSDRSSAFPTSAALSAGNGSGCYLYRSANCGYFFYQWQFYMFVLPCFILQPPCLLRMRHGILGLCRLSCSIRSISLYWSLEMRGYLPYSLYP